jgi:hypothetical protein
MTSIRESEPVALRHSLQALSANLKYLRTYTA